jgi:hypothetical protein
MATTTTQTDYQQEYIHRTSWKAGMMGALNVATAILAVRLILLASVLGAIGLTYLVLREPDPYRLAALGVYAGVVVVPLIWLTARR